MIFHQDALTYLEVSHLTLLGGERSLNVGILMRFVGGHQTVLLQLLRAETWIFSQTPVAPGKGTSPPQKKGGFC